MKYGSLALILLVCASMSLVAQIQSPSTERANDERTSAIHLLKGGSGTGATTFTALILNRFSWAKELLRELLLHLWHRVERPFRNVIGQHKCHQPAKVSQHLDATVLA